MVRRRSVSKRRVDAFTASGRVSGVDVTVTRLDNVARGFAGDYDVRGAVYEQLPPSSVRGRVPITGYLLPATFRVDGLNYDLTYDVGFVDDGKRKRYGVTRLVAGTALDPVVTLRNPAAASVDVERVTESALVRLALRASLVYGYAYEPGSVIDPATGEIVGRLNVGDELPNGAVVLGVSTARGASARKAGNSTTVGSGRVTSIAERPVSLLSFRLDDHVDDADVRLLTGQRPPGRRRADPIADADLRLIARLYVEAYNDPTVSNVPDAVRVRLIAETNGRLTYGESWIRRQAVIARRRGLLKQGRRNKKRGKK